MKNDESSFTLANTITDDNAVNAAESVELEDIYRIPHEAVDSLKEPINRVIRAFYFEDKSVNDIASEIGLSSSTVISLKAKGLRTLRRYKTLWECK